MKHILLLASKSQSRQRLLTEAQIPYNIIEQEADETQCDWNKPLDQVVKSIALHKMQHAILPQGVKEDEICFVLTADTLDQDVYGKINGKPTNRADAIAMIKRARGGSQICSAFCLEKKIWRNNKWDLIKRIERTVGAQYFFIIPDDWIEAYLQNTKVLEVSNAISIEEFGGQFLKHIDGSYTTIVGLPMFELRQALEELGFFD